MSALSEACGDLTVWLPRAAELVHEPDTDGTSSGGKPGSMPPWNPAAAAALFDATEGLRRLEASLRLAVTGKPGYRRGGSDANTTQAIVAIEALGEAVTVPVMTAAARVVIRWSVQIQQLPAVDEQERWQQIRSSVCPYCQIGMMRIAPRAGRVTCLRFGACFDSDGKHPAGLVSTNEVDGSPCIAWSDGLVT